MPQKNNRVKKIRNNLGKILFYSISIVVCVVFFILFLTLKEKFAYFYDLLLAIISGLFASVLTAMIIEIVEASNTKKRIFNLKKQYLADCFKGAEYLLSNFIGFYNEIDNQQFPFNHSADWYNHPQGFIAYTGITKRGKEYSMEELKAEVDKLKVILDIDNFKKLDIQIQTKINLIVKIIYIQSTNFAIPFERVLREKLSLALQNIVDYKQLETMRWNYTMFLKMFEHENKNISYGLSCLYELYRWLYNEIKCEGKFTCSVTLMTNEI